MEHVWSVVQDILARDIPHRRAGRPSENSNADVAAYLVDEAQEFQETLTDPDELADVLVLVFQLAQRIGCSKEELEARAVAKLRMRFTGLDLPANVAPAPMTYCLLSAAPAPRSRD